MKLFQKSTIFHEYNIEEGHQSHHYTHPYEGSPHSPDQWWWPERSVSGDPILMRARWLTGTKTLHIISGIQVCILIKIETVRIRHIVQCCLTKNMWNTMKIGLKGNDSRRISQRFLVNSDRIGSRAGIDNFFIDLIFHEPLAMDNHRRLITWSNCLSFVPIQWPHT